MHLFAVEGRPLFTHEESYYEYVPDRQQWSAARTLCHQRSGALAVASNAEEIQNLHSFLLSLNITQPVWIEKEGITQISGEQPIPCSPAPLCNEPHCVYIYKIMMPCSACLHFLGIETMYLGIKKATFCFLTYYRTFL